MYVPFIDDMRLWRVSILITESIQVSVHISQHILMCISVDLIANVEQKGNASSIRFEDALRSNHNPVFGDAWTACDHILLIVRAHMWFERHEGLAEFPHI